MSKQPWDDPNFRWYGPIRRMWLVLEGLKLGDFHLEQPGEFVDEPWQDRLIMYLDDGIAEHIAGRALLAEILNNQEVAASFS